MSRSTIIRFYVDHYETDLFKPYYLQSGPHKVGVLDNFLIGIVKFGRLIPLMDRRPDQNYNYGRVKIYIDGNIANLTVPIYKDDALIVNDMFHKPFGPANIRLAERIQM